MGKFVVKQTKNGGVKFDLLATNGQVIATSQTYKTIRSCRAGVASVIKCAAAANVEDQTAEGFVAQKCPKFEIYQDKAGEFRFRLKARNGENIGRSEGYVAKTSAMNGIASIGKNAPDADVVVE